MNMKMRLIVMNFLQFAVWGAYLTSMGTYLAGVGLGGHIGIFYAMQGIVSLFMPAVLGIVADRWIPAQRLLGLSHLLAALFMGGAGYYAMTTGPQVEFAPLFSFYSVSVAFYMPTLALSNSVAYTALDKAGLDTIKRFRDTYVRDHRFHLFHVAGRFTGIPVELHAVLYLCGMGRGAGRICPDAAGMSGEPRTGRTEVAGRGIGTEGVSALQEPQDGGVLHLLDAAGCVLADYQRLCQSVYHELQRHSGICQYLWRAACNLLISLSQISETCCILLIPFFLGRLGIKKVMLIAMVAWYCASDSSAWVTRAAGCGCSCCR